MAHTAPTIAVIGAASAQFTLDVIRDLCITESLRGSTVWLVGHVNREAVARVREVGSRYSEEMKAGLEFKVTFERREALAGADFVINTAEARPRTDERYDVDIFQLRQLAFFRDVIGDMEALCPEAWLLVAANPVFAGCTLVTRESPIKTVGLCHGFREGVRHIAEVMGFDLEDVNAQAAGVNHNVWLTHFFHKGRDAYPLLDEWIETKSREYWRSPQFNGGRIEWPNMGPKPIDMYRFFGLMPIGDTERFSGAWWYDVDEATQKAFMAVSAEWWKVYNGNRQAKTRAIEEAERNPALPVSTFIPARKSTGHDYIAVIDAIANDCPGEFQVNIPNRGAIEGVDYDVVVELPAVVSARGIQGVRVGRLPELITLYVQDHVQRMERAVRAFQAGDRNALVYAYLQDRRISSMDEAREMVSILLDGDPTIARYFSGS